ncbi:uridine kinase family protein [Legionella drancourtii]|uniref:Phosphoribulokinase/uridine kinase domain-containing protein n=1 Tax=Legionella drancourtii LLAP12 TaxID=658187 RepID=G9EUF6_9GAMM|nr:hypothetical protein [Legionella drancourtii]EHL28956.1 hypothetical protein LDG_8950 [Legionella drancourtii LLAP12]
MIFVFIGGQSASGKTGVSQHLLNELIKSGISAQILNMDDYFKEYPENTIDIEKYRLETNFDRDDMLHLDLLTEHIMELNKGNPITKPLFDFPTNRRKGTQEILPSDVLIIEGIFGQYFHKNFLPPELALVSVNVTDSYLDIVKRRIKRDIEHRGRKPEDVIKQERQFVGPGFFKYTASSAAGADVYISNQHKDTQEEQDVVLKVAAHEIIIEVKKRIAEISSGNVQPRKRTPDVQEMVAKSHLLIGNYEPKHYSGVFGNYSGQYQYQSSPEELQKSILISDLKKYIHRVEKNKEPESKEINFKYNFWFYKNSRAANREANFYLAKQLLGNLTNHPELSIQQVFADIRVQRTELITSKKINKRPDFVERNMNSHELNTIIEKAETFTSFLSESARPGY